MKKALYWSLFWIGSALLFNVLIWFYFSYEYNQQVAHAKALAFFTGYTILNPTNTKIKAIPYFSKWNLTIMSDKTK